MFPEITTRSPSVRDGRLIRDETVLVGWARIAFGALTTFVFAAVGLFAAYWVELPDVWDNPVLYLLASGVVAYLIAVWLAPWLAIERMRRPVHIDPEPGIRVAVVTTFAPPTESLEMLELALSALLELEYPHDSWLLDEADSAEARALCERLGVRHFTRRDRSEYRTASGRFAAQTKYGNYNAWLADAASADYDVLATFDPDHVPERDYLTRTLGYFADPRVGYVQSPQFYYNQDASFIARGAAEESYTFYSSLQMASHAFGEPTVTGSHTLHRLSALQTLGGFPAHDAEDLYLTLLYRGARWRGIYVPEILALGTTPVDWRGYLRQQTRWARALLDLKLRVYPKLAGRMTFVERFLALLHGAYYLRPLALVVAYPMLIYMLIANVQPSFFHRGTLFAGFSLMMVLFCADRFRQRFYLDPTREQGIHWRAVLLQFAKWPYFAKALWDALRGWNGAYEVTPKSSTASRVGGVAWPHLALALVMCAALVIRVQLHGVPRPSLLYSALGFIILSLLLVSSEALRFPPPFERDLYERRRTLLAERLVRRQ